MFLPVCAVTLAVLVIWAQFWSGADFEDENRWFGMAWAYLGILLCLVALCLAFVATALKHEQDVLALALGLLFGALEMLVLQMGQSLLAVINLFFEIYVPRPAAEGFLEPGLVLLMLLLVSCVWAATSLDDSIVRSRWSVRVPAGLNGAAIVLLFILYWQQGIVLNQGKEVWLVGVLGLTLALVAFGLVLVHRSTSGRSRGGSPPEGAGDSLCGGGR